MNKEQIEKVTNSLIEVIDKDGLEWIKTWKFKMPKNNESKKIYRGFNVYSCLLTMHKLKTSNNKFLTMNQISNLDGSVRAGQKGTPIVYYTMFKKDVKDKATGKIESKSIPFLKYYYVWNITQTNLKIDEDSEQSIQDVMNEAVLDGRVAKYSNQPKIEKGIYDPCYVSDRDIICMPNDNSFNEVTDRYAELIHQLVRSTGHKTRLDREQSTDKGSIKYAEEEILTEMTTSLICSALGFQDKVKYNSAAYIKTWLEAAKLKPQMLMTLMNHSQKIIDYMQILEV